MRSTETQHHAFNVDVTPPLMPSIDLHDMFGCTINFNMHTFVAGVSQYNTFMMATYRCCTLVVVQFQYAWWWSGDY